MLEQADLAKAVTLAKQMVEDMKREREIMAVHVELLAALINDERASKRARA